MKKIIVIITLSLAMWPAVASVDSIPTFNNIEEARAKAASENRAILMVFAGSDWCRPCMQFKKDILENKLFQHYAAEHIVLVYLDFPSRRQNKLSKEQTAYNEALAAKYNPNGTFPEVLLINQKETVLGRLPFHNQNAISFVEECKEIMP